LCYDYYIIGVIRLEEDEMDGNLEMDISRSSMTQVKMISVSFLQLSLVLARIVIYHEPPALMQTDSYTFLQTKEIERITAFLLCS